MTTYDNNTVSLVVLTLLAHSAGPAASTAPYHLTEIHSPLITGLQLQSTTIFDWFLSALTPVGKVKLHLLDLMLIRKTSRSKCTVPLC